MRRKHKCTVCGYRFFMDKENKYQAIKPRSFTEAFTKTLEMVDCFDCPKCGCQNVVNTVVGNKITELCPSVFQDNTLHEEDEDGQI